VQHLNEHTQSRHDFLTMGGVVAVVSGQRHAEDDALFGGPVSCDDWPRLLDPGFVFKHQR
jgi:hypothetical protein